MPPVEVIEVQDSGVIEISVPLSLSHFEGVFRGTSEPDIFLYEISDRNVTLIEPAFENIIQINQIDYTDVYFYNEHSEIAVDLYIKFWDHEESYIKIIDFFDGMKNTKSFELECGEDWLSLDIPLLCYTSDDEVF